MYLRKKIRTKNKLLVVFGSMFVVFRYQVFSLFHFRIFRYVWQHCWEEKKNNLNDISRWKWKCETAKQPKTKKIRFIYLARNIPKISFTKLDIQFWMFFFLLLFVVLTFVVEVLTKLVKPSIFFSHFLDSYVKFDQVLYFQGIRYHAEWISFSKSLINSLYFIIWFQFSLQVNWIKREGIAYVNSEYFQSKNKRKRETLPSSEARKSLTA